MIIYDIDKQQIIDTNIVEIKLYYKEFYIGNINNADKVSISKQDKFYIVIDNISIIATNLKIVKNIEL